ncbi:unnamed protein product [Arabis nemorensis]|uniref:DOG1 domain-containing protein n=1 Tax=Arabis nemorensis TaxID=586526 RepID=A0A565CFZ8_9BRAS|nr:unnamed protein product [Arabis nemorensis]
MDSSSSSHGIEQLQQGCYYEWMSLQAKHIVNLKEALMKNDAHHKLEELVGVIVNDFQRYAEKRSELSNRSCSSYFAPSWNSSLENGLLWMGGCRPSSFIRVIYALCGSQTETQFSSQYFHKIDGNENADESDGFMSELTAMQLGNINELHIKVIHKEDKITKQSANMQEDVVDMPIAVTAYSRDLVEAGVEVEDALDKHEEGMAVLMAEADKLRIETLRKIVEVMTPVQAAEFLLAGKRLHVSLHEWGRVREERRFGRAHAGAVAGGAGAGKPKRSATC